MAKEIPISKVRPTHSSMKTVKFTNIDKEDFIHPVGGKRVRFGKGKSFYLPETFAVHFARNLAQKIIFRSDASLLEYAGVDAKADRERTAKGENPMMLPVGKEKVHKIMEVILDGHQVKQVPAGDDVVDASEIGTPVSDEKPKKPSKKADKKSKKSKKEEADVEENEEDVDNDFEDVDEE
jgi:hypothetical protein